MEILFQQSIQKVHTTNTQLVRSIMQKINWSSRLIGIKGARGIGKTTLLLQYMKLHLSSKLDESLYVSLDNFWFASNTLHDLVHHFVQKGGKYLFLDEVHKYPNWSQALKNFYDDYPQLQIVFTGSSLLEILNSKADLSRRAIVYYMQGLSFREYLSLETQVAFNTYTLEDILKNHKEIALEITSKMKPLKYFSTYLKHGYYPFYKENPELYFFKLEEVVNLMLEIELPQLRQVDMTYIPKLKQLLAIIAASVPFTPNTTKISEKIQINRNTLIAYFHYLSEIGLTINLTKDTFGTSLLQKPNKIYLKNTNLSYLLAKDNTNMGNLRETFFANQLSYQSKINYTSVGDFLINETYTFEIGGKSKSNKQIETIPNGFVVLDDLEIGSFNKIPLWLFGFLY